MLPRAVPAAAPAAGRGFGDRRIGQFGNVAGDVGSGGSAPAVPKAPEERSSGGWKAAVRATARRVTQHRVSVSAGSLAYHGFLAFFPAIIAALGILTLVQVGTGTLHDLTQGIGKALPTGAAGVFDTAVKAASRRHTGTLSAAIVGIVIALWSSSSAMAVLQQTLNVAYGVSSDRKFFARRVRGAGLMVVTVALGGCAAALVVFGQPIGRAISGVVPVGGAAFDTGWTVVRWVVAAGVVAVLFSSYYSLGPNRKGRWRWVTPGSALASAVFLVASLGFSLYISAFGSYGRTYGSFAGVAILVLWLYLSGIAVLLGAELNAELELRRARQDQAGTPTPGATWQRGGVERGTGARTWGGGALTPAPTAAAATTAPTAARADRTRRQEGSQERRVGE